MFVSTKAKAVHPSSTLAIDAKFKAMKAEGIDVVGFGTGEPDFDTPAHIKHAAIRAIEEGFTKYTPASGMLALKKAVCTKLKRDNGLDYTPEQIVISNGAKHSLMNVFTAICNPGDEVIIPTPYWVSYPEMVALADGVPVFVTTDEKTGFKMTPEALAAAITSRTRAVVLNSPSNPTGMVYTEDELRALAQTAVSHDIYIVSDEVYEHLVYDGNRHVSVASFGGNIQEHTIVVNAVSKTYAMTGWRIGFTACGNELAKAMGNIQSHATSNPNSIAQAAAIAALEGPLDAVFDMREAFRQRRDYMVQRINAMPLVSCTTPGGAFYVMMNMQQLIGRSFYGHTISGSDDFAQLLLEQNKVAVVPGSGFGAEGYVRWSYATSMESIQKGLDRLEQFLNAES